MEKYILSIGRNDYRYYSGGTNKVIKAHSELFKKNEIGYIFICPVKNSAGQYFHVIKNQCYKGVFYVSDIPLMLGMENIVEIHIHSIIDASIDATYYILKSLRSRIRYYLHDYYTICPSYKLLRNDKTFCGYSKMSESKCNGCKYLSEFKRETEIILFLEKIKDRTTFIAPSDYVKHSWSKAFPEYSDEIEVIYHQELIGEYKGNSKCNNIPRIAYLGEPIDSKGWSIFNKTYELSNKDKMEFYYFGQYKVDKTFRRITVCFNKNLDGMIEALRANEIDCALLWASCGETYSYTYYECLAANVFVITNRMSGNICDQVEERGNGIVLSSEKELFDLFSDSEKLKKLIVAYKESNQKCPGLLVENRSVLDSIRNTDNCFECRGTSSNAYSQYSAKKYIKEKIVAGTMTAYYMVKQIYYIMKKMMI